MPGWLLWAVVLVVFVGLSMWRATRFRRHEAVGATGEAGDRKQAWAALDYAIVAGTVAATVMLVVTLIVAGPVDNLFGQVLEDLFVRKG